MDNGGCSRKPVKIVIITTQYVETDATSFKSVVQKLTGKDSSDHHVAAVTKAKRVGHNNVGGVEVPCASTAGGHGSSFFIRDMSSSFKEFDTLLREMPPINDDLWSEVLQLN